MPYLDHCATTPLDPEVRRAMDAAMERLASGELANPSSVHAPGRKARALLNESRAKVAALIGARPEEIVFTASGSEANNLAIKGAAFRAPGRPFHIVVSAIEHDSVRFAARWLAERLGWIRLSEVPPDSEGIISAAAIEAACGEGASLICVMAVNNETGAIQPTAEIAEVARRRGALFVVDGVQSAGRIPTDVRALGCDCLSLSSHKLYGPRGVGALYVKHGTKLDALVHGGHQEKSVRAGTENLEGIAGFACAAELAVARRAQEAEKLEELASIFLTGLTEKGIPYSINGPVTAKRAPGVINLSVRGIQSQDMVIGMDLAGFSISAGAACSSGVIEPSHVLQAMSLDPWRVEGGVRLSFGHANTIEEASAAAEAFSNLCASLGAIPTIPQGA